MLDAGYVPDDNALRGRCFTLMTLISMIHNLSRSVGCAMIAVTDKNSVVAFVGGEYLLYFLYKLARGELLYWMRVDGVAGLLASIFSRVIFKVVVDFR